MTSRFSEWSWQKSPYSDTDNCVELGRDNDGVLTAIRDSKAGTAGPVLTFPPGSIQAFLDHAAVSVE